jgi:hypothetical protein
MRKADSFHLRELEEIIGEEALSPVSPIMPENPSRPQTREIPGPMQTAKGVTFDMATPPGATAGRVPPIIITTEQLQQLRYQLQPHYAMPNSNPKVEDPQHYYGERPKLQVFPNPMRTEIQLRSEQF